MKNLNVPYQLKFFMNAIFLYSIHEKFECSQTTQVFHECYTYISTCIAFMKNLDVLNQLKFFINVSNLDLYL